MDAAATAPQKAHRASRSKKSKKKTATSSSSKRHAVAKPGALARRIRFSADRSEKRASNPTLPVDRNRPDATPRVVAVVGPPAVGKSTIIRNLVRHYSKRNLPSITGPVTVVAGRRKRLTFVEVSSNLSDMIDVAKVADLVLLVIDASYGFEMETFEFLNVAAAHGMPKIMAVLTHLDKLRDGKIVRRAKKSFKDRIWAELYQGAKVFYLSGITTTQDYLNREVLNLARFISVSKPPNLKWRADHPYVLADRVEDITPKTLPAHANRTVAAYGYIRGTPLRTSAGLWRLHLAGVGDLVANNVELLPDPCPAPELPADQLEKDSSNVQRRKRKVSERERMVHAPMAPEVDGISYDRDAVYININRNDVRFSDTAALLADNNSVPAQPDGVSPDSSDGEGEKMVKSMQTTKAVPVDESLKQASLQLIKGGKRIISEQFSDGRRRRRVEFLGDSPKDDLVSEEGSSDSGSSSSEESDGSDGVAAPLERPELGQQVDSEDPEDSEGDDGKDDEGFESGSAASDELEERSEEGDDSGDEGLGEGAENENEVSAQRWKSKMLDNAAKRLQSSGSPSKALAKYIYGKDAAGNFQAVGVTPVGEEESLPQDEEEENSDDDAFFTPRRKRASVAEADGMQSFTDAVMDDITRMLPSATRDWISDTALCARLKRARFGTGQRSVNNVDADDDDDASMHGDFEDLETGEVQSEIQVVNGEKCTEGMEDELEKGDKSFHAKKLLQKQKFNEEWDKRGEKNDSEEDDDSQGNGNGKSDYGHLDVKSRKAARDAAERVPDARKVERERLEKLKMEAFKGLDMEARIALEGILPGNYVRLELQDVPVEFVKYFDPNSPVVLGGLKASDDEGLTFLRARIRRHRFKRGVLKSSDPVVFSIGWRRFQSVPIYDTEDQGGRRRFLKYTPEYLHCNTTFWGPSVAPGAGVIMCQTLGRNRGGFRIAGTGVVTEVDASFNVVKKLKLIGEAVKVFKNTAFIKGMFNSELEVSKYIGASIRTVSGIRGTIKKAISEASQRGGLDREVGKSPAGTFRAGFEDKILLSDIVFLRAWVPVEAPKFCSIATTLLDRERSGNGDGTWRMRTIREIRQANELPIPLNKDSLYKDVERTTPAFAPLKLSRKLEGSLPYASKPKQFLAKKGTKSLVGRKAAVVQERAVVLEKKERQEHKLLQAVYTIRNDRAKRRKESNERRLARRKKEWEREEAKHAKTSSERRKRKFAIEGAQQAREAKRSRGGGRDED